MPGIRLTALYSTCILALGAAVSALAGGGVVTPAPVTGSGQGRGSSGIIFNNLHEIQVYEA